MLFRSNKAKEKGVSYQTGSVTIKSGKVLAQVRIKNRRREIWIKTSDARVAEKFKEIADDNAKVWFGGHVVPDEKAEHGFYFSPGTIIVQPNENNVASLIRVTLDKISKRPDYYNKNGLMTPNRWFVQGQVIDYRLGDE